MENYIVAKKRGTLTASAIFSARPCIQNLCTPNLPANACTARYSEAIEDVFLIDSRCFVRSVSRAGRQNPENLADPPKLKCSFSTRKLLKMQNQFVDGRYVRQHQIVNYDGQLAELRRQRLQHEKEVNHAAKRKAEESDQFSRLYALRRVLIRK